MKSQKYTYMYCVKKKKAGNCSPFDRKLIAGTVLGLGIRRAGHDSYLQIALRQEESETRVGDSNTSLPSILESGAQRNAQRKEQRPEGQD